ncbi:MAG: hypothetical protein JWN70_3423 [Planctomycetaceae bacterium]|nr:hypothetical protein [Planctomycetaceae bacterium]
MVKLVAPLFSLAISIGVECVIIAAVIWGAGEIASMNASANGIPMSEFPKSTLELDKPIPADELTML